MTDPNTGVFKPVTGKKYEISYTVYSSPDDVVPNIILADCFEGTVDCFTIVQLDDKTKEINLTLDTLWEKKELEDFIARYFTSIGVYTKLKSVI